MNTKKRTGHIVDFAVTANYKWGPLKKLQDPVKETWRTCQIV